MTTKEHMSNLTAADLGMFAKIGAAPELLELAEVVRVTDREARNEYGIQGSGDMAGIAFPYFDPETMSNGRRRSYVRIRRDHPEHEDGKEKKKYVAPYGDRKRLYFPPTPELFADTTVPIVLVEAEKSALSMTAWAARTGGRKILPIAMGGCYGWVGKTGIATTATGERVPETGAIRDLNICRDGRKTYILLDANCASNPHVLAARSQLVRQLRKQGADTHILDLPTGDGVNGPDDYIGVCGDQAMADVFEAGASGISILNDVEAFIKRFVVMSDSQAAASALWILHTYCFKVGIYTPYYAITSAAKRSGKSRLLEVISYVAHRPWMTSGASASSLFREIDQKRPTLLMDELDTLIKGNPELAEAVRCVLNAGAHHKGTVSRVVGQGTEMKTKDFSVFCPKAMAAIGKLPDTVSDRSIPIRLERKLHSYKVERFRERTIKGDADRLRERMEVWIDKKLPALKNAEPDLPEELNDRQQDGAEVLLALADVAGGDWSTKARRALIELYTGDAAEDQSTPILLLTDIRVVFGDQAEDKITTTDLLDQLVKVETSPWPEWSHGKPMTPVGLSRMLKPFGIYPKIIRVGTSVARGYERSQFQDAFERYLPKTALQNVTPLQTNIHAGPDHFSTCYTDPSVTGSKSEESSISMRVVTDVTGKDPTIEGRAKEDPPQTNLWERTKV